MITTNTKPSSIEMLDDDCLESIFKIFTCNIKEEFGDYDNENYGDILLQLQLARSCTRFRDVFIHMIWKSKEKHLTLRPQQLYRTLGPLNFSFYIKAMQWKLVKLEIEEHYLHWFLMFAHTAGIESFPSTETCILKNNFLKPVKDDNIRLLIKFFLPNLKSLTLHSPISSEELVDLKHLTEFHSSNHSPIEHLYFQDLISTLQNLRVLQISSPLSRDISVDDIADITFKLPERLEVLYLNISFANLALSAIFGLKNLKRLILMVLSSHIGLQKDLKVVNTILLEKIGNLTGFGLNKMYDSVLRVWKFPKEMIKISGISKIIFSAYECAPSIVDFERCLEFKNVTHLCLRNCFVIQNDTVLRLVEISMQLQNLDLNRCYAIVIEDLLMAITTIRQRQNAKNQLLIYSDDENLEIQLTTFWQLQRYIKIGDKCPIDLEETGFIFEFN